MGISDNETITSTDFEPSNNELTKATNDHLEVVTIPVQIEEHRVIDGARQILEILRPDWDPANIHFKVFD